MFRHSRRRSGVRIASLAAATVLLASLPSIARAATKTVDLDGQSANGAESKCDLNVLSTFPVKVENVVTNKAVGDAFDFSWKSAGPGGFTSSAAVGTSGGVGAKWTWTTNQSVYSFTGGSCADDVCFLETTSSPAGSSVCNTSCVDDGTTVTVAKGANAGEVVLTWTGGTAPYTVYRSSSPVAIDQTGNSIGTSSAQSFTDLPPGGVVFYKIRGASCNQRKSCTTNADCNPANEGSCVTRGPFAVPGRSLFSDDITVSSASLTSSLVTFFSPPKEVFRVTSTATPGAVQETLSNNSTQPVTVVTEAYPPGCCPGDPATDHKLTCDGVCVDYLTDPNHCGACGNVCGEGTCCSNGNCASLCAPGQVWCNGACVDPQNDPDNCGACGNACGEGTCCSGGTCVGETSCDAGEAFCDGQCLDVLNDNDNCGACGNVCGEGSCCSNGVCEAFSACEAGRTFCDGLCYDTMNDPNNCGACGNVCDSTSTCSNGVCSPCTGEGGRKDACDNTCVNLNTDPYNCGACGVSCNLSCPSGFKGVCSNGQSCRCVEGTPAPQPPSNVPPPTEPFCQNPNDPGAPSAGFCPNPIQTGPVQGVCPNPGPPAPEVEETPVCTVNPGETTLPPGATATTCRPGGAVYKEVVSVVSVCGDDVPGPDGTCADGISNVSEGTFMRLVPATEVEIGDAHLTPYAVHVLSDTSMDGLIQPGETASVVIDVLNAGPVAIVDAQATLIAPPVDLTEDGISNPVGATVSSATSSYGTIAGTQPTVDCAPLQLHPAGNAVPFQVTLPLEHPGDTARPFQLLFTGTVNGAPFSATVPIALGVADRCDYALATGDYDGLDGLLTPMARLVPAGDPVPFPSKSFQAGNTRPMKLRALCGGVELRGADVDSPQIVALSEATRGPIDISQININDDTGTNDPYFRWNDSTKQWIFNLRTDQIGTGVFTITIRVASRKDYVTGFELK